MSSKKPSSHLNFDFPPPLPSPIQISPIQNDQHRSFKQYNPHPVVLTPVLDILNINFLELAFYKKEEKIKERKKERTEFIDDKELCFDEIIKESFLFIDDEPFHPYDAKVEKEYKVLPFESNPYDFVASNNNSEFIIKEMDKKVPSEIKIEDELFTCTAMDISDYIFMWIENDVVYFREIGANLKMKKKVEKKTKNEQNIE